MLQSGFSISVFIPAPPIYGKLPYVPLDSRMQGIRLSIGEFRHRVDRNAVDVEFHHDTNAKQAFIPLPLNPKPYLERLPELSQILNPVLPPL